MGFRLKAVWGKLHKRQLHYNCCSAACPPFLKDALPFCPFGTFPHTVGNHPPRRAEPARPQFAYGNKIKTASFLEAVFLYQISIVLHRQQQLQPDTQPMQLAVPDSVDIVRTPLRYRFYHHTVHTAFALERVTGSA